MKYEAASKLAAAAVVKLNQTSKATHLADIEASAEHISADEDLGLSPPELAHHSVTVLKRHVTLQHKLSHNMLCTMHRFRLHLQWPFHMRRRQ
jgi:hypothetical protein